MLLFNISEINLMAKINIAKNLNGEDLNTLISNISLYSNSQSKVSRVDLRSRDPKMDRIKQLSDTDASDYFKAENEKINKESINTNMAIIRQNKARIYKDFDLSFTKNAITGDLNKKITNLSRESADTTIWVIGGPNIIKQTINILEEFYLSRIPGNYGCDTFLPTEIIEKMFEKTWTEKHKTVEFQVWKKRLIK